MSPKSGKSVFSKLHGIMPTHMYHLKPVLAVLFFCGVGGVLGILSSFRHLMYNPDIDVNRVTTKEPRRKRMKNTNFKLLFNEPDQEDLIPVRMMKNGHIKIYGVNDHEENAA